MSDNIVGFDGNPHLTPEKILANATARDQTKVIVLSIDDKGKAEVFSTDMTAAEFVFMSRKLVKFADDFAATRNLKDFV